MNKKGDAGAGSKGPYYAVFALFLVPAILLFIIAARTYIESYVYVDQRLIEESYADRAISCVGIRDPDIERTYLIMDTSLINDRRITECFFEGNRNVRLSLEDSAGRVVAAGENDVKIIGTARRPYTVLYLENNVKKQGMLTITISKPELK